MILGFIKLKLNLVFIVTSDMGSHGIIQLSCTIGLKQIIHRMTKTADSNGWFNWLQSD